MPGETIVAVTVDAIRARLRLLAVTTTE